MLHWLLKYKYQAPPKSQRVYVLKITDEFLWNKINSKLSQHRTVCFACSSEILGILTNMQEPYIATTSRTLFHQHIGRASKYSSDMFSYPGVRPQSLWGEIGTFMMRYWGIGFLELLTSLKNVFFIIPAQSHTHSPNYLQQGHLINLFRYYIQT